MRKISHNMIIIIVINLETIIAVKGATIMQDCDTETALKTIKLASFKKS